MSLESARFPYNFPKDEDHSQKCSGTSRSARIATATIVKQIQFPSTHSPCSIKMALSPTNISTDSASGASPIAFGEDSRFRSEVGSFYLAANGAGRYSD